MGGGGGGGGAKIPRKNGTGVQISQGFHFPCDTGSFLRGRGRNKGLAVLLDRTGTTGTLPHCTCGYTVGRIFITKYNMHPV